MRPRIRQELDGLRSLWPGIEHKAMDDGDWFRIPSYDFPPGWELDGGPCSAAPIIFTATAAYPAGEPYAFWAPAKLTFGGATPSSTTPATNAAFGDECLQFSWAPDGTWIVGGTDAGSNLSAWARSFTRRLEQGI